MTTTQLLVQPASLATSKSVQPRRLAKLAAIDLDGTLLGPNRQPSAENLAAVARLQAKGISIVIASGRHFEAVAPIATQLSNVDWYVCSQGAEVCNASRSRVLDRVYMTPQEVELVMNLGDQLGLASLVQVPEGTLTDSTREEYLAYHDSINGRSARQIPRAEMLQRQIYKVLWVGAPEYVAGLRHLREVMELPLQGLHTEHGIFEVMPHAVTKANGLTRLTAHLGLAANEVVAFGDGENDIAMFRWAGASFAMPHGHPNALRAAKFIAPSGPPETALARAIDQYLIR